MYIINLDINFLVVSNFSSVEHADGEVAYIKRLHSSPLGIRKTEIYVIFEEIGSKHLTTRMSFFTYLLAKRKSFISYLL